MLARSLFKPIFTNYWSKAVSFTASLNKDDFVGGVTNTNNINKIKLTLKKSRVKTLFTFSKIFLSDKRVVTDPLSSAIGPFGPFFSRSSTKKLVAQVVSTDAPVAIFFNNFSNIPISLCGKKVAVYNGKLLMPIYIKRSLLGFSFKHLIRCKKIGRIIHASSLLVNKTKKKN